MKILFLKINQVIINCQNCSLIQIHLSTFFQSEYWLFRILFHQWQEVGLKVWNKRATVCSGSQEKSGSEEISWSWTLKLSYTISLSLPIINHDCSKELKIFPFLSYMALRASSWFKGKVILFFVKSSLM